MPFIMMLVQLRFNNGAAFYWSQVFSVMSMFLAKGFLGGNQDIPFPGPNDKQRWLRMMHVNNSHATPGDMVQIAKDAGANKYLIEQARAYRCPLCAAEARAGQRRHAALPLRARYFNAVVMWDLGLLILERAGEG